MQIMAAPLEPSNFTETDFNAAEGRILPFKMVPGVGLEPTRDTSPNGF